MSIRLNKALKEFNIGKDTAVEFLAKKGHEIESNPNTKLSDEQYDLLRREFQKDEEVRRKATELSQGRQQEKKEKKAQKSERRATEEVKTVVPEDLRPQIKIKGQVDLEAPASAEPAPEEGKKVEKPVEVPTEEKPAISDAPKEVESAPVKETTAKPEEPVKVEATQKESKPTEPMKETSSAPKSEVNEAHSATEKPKKPAKPTKEEREQQIGETKNGVFELRSTPELSAPKVVGQIDLSTLNQSTRPKKKGKDERRKEREKKKRSRIGAQRVDINATANQLQNNERRKPNNNGNNNSGNNQQASQSNNRRRNRKVKEVVKTEISEEDVAKQVKETLARLTNKSNKNTKGAKYRKEKREQVREREEELRREERAESKILKLTEFVTANELATMMNVPVTKVIGTCMSIGVMVSINQRLDAETIDIVADEFGFKTEFVSAEVQDAVQEEEDDEENLEPRAPIVTVMGHVDHGKTSLLDYIRKANVIAGEAGGITQHIGAYNVQLESGRHITFLDTPGHEAFTAMRARGAQVTDIAIIIIAADDDIMPQTKEAINHAVAANVPIVFAINKVDKPTANPDKIKESLAAMNFLVEEWGGKYQSQDISAKKGIGIKELLEKVLLEADMLDLKANPNRKATGTIIESALDKGRGYVATILVSNGTLHQGDVVLAGTNFGRVKALFNERSQRIDNVGPSMAATLLGFNGAPQAGDQFHVMDTEQEAREITAKREQLQREQDLRTHKMLTLDELGRRIKQGNYQELNIIVKGDVDGSVEALSDSFIKLSTPEIAVNVIHKGVGQISENDVTLAAASQAVIVGFQVRPSQAARKIADRDGVEIRQYSIIYDAIDDVKKAMEGMLQPILKEEVTATLDVRQVYHISKVGYVAGAYVSDGKVHRTDKARLIRDGIVIFSGGINALKRFKDDVKEIGTNFECGISLVNCNDIKEGDIIETYQEVEVKQKL